MSSGDDCPRGSQPRPRAYRRSDQKKGGAITVAPTPLHRQPHHRALAWIVGAFALVAVGVGIGLIIDSQIFESSSSSNAVQGSGVAATETREVPPFTGVDLAGGNNVTVRVGGERSVVVRGDSNLLSRITTQVEDGNLVIGQMPGNFETKSPTRLEVSVPSLDDVTLTGRSATAPARCSLRSGVALAACAGNHEERAEGLGAALDRWRHVAGHGGTR